MTNRERVLEEVRTAFAAAILSGTLDASYIPRSDGAGGCSTCGHSSEQLFSMDGINAIIDALKIRPIDKSVVR